MNRSLHPSPSAALRLRALLPGCALLALLAVPSRAEQVFAKPPAAGGGVNASSWVSPDGSDSDMYAWDEFTLDHTQTITEVRWRGGYALGAPYGHVSDFRISFFDSVAGGFQPYIVAIPENESQEVVIATFHTNNNAGETYAGTSGGVAMYDYRYVLPTPVTLQGGVKYWFRVVGAQAVYPDWGMATGTGGDGHYFRYSTGLAMFHTMTNDLSFSLHAKWADLGGALAGSAGLPALSGSGTLAAGSNCALGLAGARPAAPVTGVVGLSALNAPFKGGTMVPVPTLIVALASDATGHVTLPFTMPAGFASGASFYVQFWIQDPAGPKGLAASNGLAGTVP
jgi:hypothetical protein